MTIRIAHLTDVHLPLPARGLAALWALPRDQGLGAFRNKRASGLLSWALRRSRRHLAEALARVEADVAAFRPDLVLVTGDLVHLALPCEFPEAARWLARMAELAPLRLVPGNHDAYMAGALEAGGRAWAHWTRGCVAHGDYPWLEHWGPLVLVGLSTAVPRPLGDAGGRLGEAQLARTARVLQEQREGLRLVLLHHPPLPLGSRRRALDDHEALAAHIRRHGAELILCGHEHRALEGRLVGPHGPVPVLVGPSASLAHGRHPGGWWALELDARERRLTARLRTLDGRGLTTARTCHLPLPGAAVPRIPAMEVAAP